MKLRFFGYPYKRETEKLRRGEEKTTTERHCHIQRPTNEMSEKNNGRTYGIAETDSEREKVNGFERMIRVSLILINERTTELKKISD